MSEILTETYGTNVTCCSGAEDKHGYLWDRHYGVCLTKFPHTDVVNCVAFNPTDPEVLISASDDQRLKIWRSRNREREVKGACAGASAEKPSVSSA